MSATLLGMTIKRNRQLKGWSQEELAKRIGGVADQAAISRLENGLIADPGSKLIFHIAKALDMKADELLSILCMGDTEADASAEQTTIVNRDDEIAKVQTQVYKLLDRIEELKHQGAAARK